MLLQLIGDLLCPCDAIVHYSSPHCFSLQHEITISVDWLPRVASVYRQRIEFHIIEGHAVNIWHAPETAGENRKISINFSSLFTFCLQNHVGPCICSYSHCLMTYCPTCAHVNSCWHVHMFISSICCLKLPFLQCHWMKTCNSEHTSINLFPSKPAQSTVNSQKDCLQ